MTYAASHEATRQPVLASGTGERDAPSALARWAAGPRIAPLPVADPDQGAPALSFEFFPPKNDVLEQQLWHAVRRLERLAPRFVSVTYGAGGSTQARTHAIVARIVAETSLVPAAHLTCVAASRSDVDEVARAYWDAGVRHIVALRGDMPGGGRYEPHPLGYRYAADLVAGLRRIGDFEISVAAYPEAHPDAVTAEADLDNLKRKLDAGAARAITQYFFDPETYLRFLDRALAAGITAPIVPGILPVTNFAQVEKFSASCGASVPAWLRRLFEGLDDDQETRRMVATVVAAEQVRLLQANGIDEFHFYTLNRPELVHAIAHILGVRPRAAAT
jgi:methylenetetrahydrofolate reductase (NADPH)